MSSEMEMSSPLTLILACILLLTLYFMRKGRRGVSIPGPMGIPLIGSALELLNNNPLHLLDKWKTQYGDLCRFRVFNREIIIVSGLDLLREVLVTKSTEFAGRPKSFRFSYAVGFHDEVANTTFSQKWVKTKKAMINSIKMYGERLSLLEELTQGIVQETCQSLEETKGKAIDIKPYIHHGIMDILTSLVFGRVLEKKNLKEISEIDTAMMVAISPLGNGVELDVFPFLRFLPNKSFATLKNIVTRMDAFLDSEIKQNRENYDPDNATNANDILLKLQHSEKCLSDDELKKLVQNLIVGGVSTTTISIHALLAILAANQHIQHNIHQELDSIIGNRVICLKDRQILPYLEATTLELLRYTSIGPVAIPHSTLSDVTLGGFHIPKGTEIWPNLWALHHSEEYWQDPWKFKPERFLENGELLPLGHPIRKNMMPFGAGRRVCPGETLAKNRMFLFVASLLQKFEFLPPDDSTTLPINPREYHLSLALEPGPYTIKAVARNINAKISKETA